MGELQNKNYWLFSGMPDQWTTYDVDIKNGGTSWRMTSFDGVHVGDYGFIKLGGKISSILAQVEIISVNGKPFIPNEKKKYQQEVTIKVIENYLNQQFTIDRFKNNKDLYNKLTAQGSSFKLLDDEYKSILSEITPYTKGKKTVPKTTQPLNQILYGPPGTGKTYNTINKALEILEGVVPDDRKEAKEKFEEYKKVGQIEFVTFHQSYGYEEFVEGIKADLESDDIKYKLEEGVFQVLSREAEKNYSDFENSQKQTKPLLDITKLLNDFANEVQTNLAEGKEIILLKNSNTTKALIGGIKRKSDASLQSFITSGSVKDQSLTISVIIRDYQDFLDGKIKRYTDVKPSFESQSSYHGNAIYYFELYRLIKDFQDKSSDKYLSKTSDIELKNHILIIDEINRGNISKIFGELITLIEPSKRIGANEALHVRLPYSNELFGVPQNLYIIGTMNTADRSIALMDTALRRRFDFTEMMPDLSTLDNLNVDGIDVKAVLETINKRIEYLYDRDHTIGHAYFMSLKDDKITDKKAELDNIFRNKIIPLLQEYFYDDWEKILMVLGNGFIEKKELKSDIFDYKTDEYLEDEKYLYTINKEFDFSKFA